MSFENDDFPFCNYNDNFSIENNSLFEIYNENANPFNFDNLEEEEKTDLYKDEHYFYNNNNNYFNNDKDKDNNNINENININNNNINNNNNDNNNAINNNSNEFNIYKNTNNNIKNKLVFDDKTKETTYIVRNDNTPKEIPENDNKLLNKKRENSDSNSGKNSRFSSDNTIRKIKHLILDSSLKFINEQIRKIYNNNIGFGVFQKKLLTLNQGQKVDASISFNKQFMKKKLYEIFSDKVSSRYTSFPGDFNKKLITNLMEEEDLEKRAFFQKLFNLTFLDCLSHFRGTIKIKELEGLKCFSDYLKNHSDDKDYNMQLEYYLLNFEEKIDNKRSRNTKKKKQNDN